MKLSDIQYLRQYSNFCETTASFIRYQRDPIASQKLLETYSLSEIAGDNDDFTRALRLTQWLCAHVRHDGSYGNNDPQDAWSLLSLFYGKDHVGNQLPFAFHHSGRMLFGFIHSRPRRLHNALFLSGYR